MVQIPRVQQTQVGEQRRGPEGRTSHLAELSARLEPQAREGMGQAALGAPSAESLTAPTVCPFMHIVTSPNYSN